MADLTRPAEYSRGSWPVRHPGAGATSDPDALDRERADIAGAVDAADPERVEVAAGEPERDVPRGRRGKPDGHPAAVIGPPLDQQGLDTGSGIGDLPADRDAQ